MSNDLLYTLLDGVEWKDLELKEAKHKLPESIYETVSAFLNTEGGHIILGVDDQRNITGVENADKIQNDFLGELHNPERLGSQVHCKETLKNHDGKTVLIFYIPEANRKDKPVYVKTKKQGNVAFIRKGGGDYKCGKTELDRLISDAQSTRPDTEQLDLTPDECLDARSIKWYRHRYESKGGNRSLDSYTDDEFLQELGLAVEEKGQLHTTMAALLLLGKASRIRQYLPRPVVDCYHYAFNADHPNTGERWQKRITCEDNIVNSWQAILDWYSSFAATPFEIDPRSGQRTDTPPDFIAFREAAINLLSHQDFSDHARSPVIENFTDRLRFWNPGDAFADEDQLLKPGTKEVRNPILVRALRDIGFSEQSGWGLRDVYRNWHELGRVPPAVNNDKADKSFQLELRRNALMSPQQQQLQQQLGIQLSPKEAEAFANLCATDTAEITRSALRAALGINGADTQKIVHKLITQGVAVAQGEHSIALAAHLIPLRDQLFNAQSPEQNAATGKLSTAQGDLSTAQVEPLDSLTEKQQQLLHYCYEPRSMAEIQQHLGASHRGYFKENHLAPLLAHGLIAMTVPDKPRSSKQQYVITDKGKQAKTAG